MNESRCDAGKGGAIEAVAIWEPGRTGRTKSDEEWLVRNAFELSVSRQANDQVTKSVAVRIDGKAEVLAWPEICDVASAGVRVTIAINIASDAIKLHANIKGVGVGVVAQDYALHIEAISRRVGSSQLGRDFADCAAVIWKDGDIELSVSLSRSSEQRDCPQFD